MDSTAQKADRVLQWIFTVNPNDNPIYSSFRCCLRVIVIMLHEAVQTKLTIRASALTYTVILSMVPILAMSTAVLKGMGSGDQMRVAAERFITQLEPASSPPASSSTSEAVDAGDQPATSLSSHLRKAVDTIFDYVENTNFAALGVFGVVGLLVVVIMVFSAVEDAMNAIWKTTKGRSIIRKIMDYIALLILLPVSINTALAGEAILASEKIMGYIHTIIPFPWMVKAVLKFLPFLFIVLTLMMMYLFFSRARVTTTAAFAGAVFASIFWFIVQKIYIVLQIGVANYNAIYGSFATVPLFLVWLHLGWTIILLGATLAYAVQNRNNHPGFHDTVTPQRDLQLAYDILQVVFTDFRARRLTTVTRLSKQLPFAKTIDIKRITKRLTEANVLRSIDERNGHGLVPATSAEKVEPVEILDIIFGNESIPTAGGKLAAAALDGARQTLAPHTIPSQQIGNSQ